MFYFTLLAWGLLDAVGDLLSYNEDKRSRCSFTHDETILPFFDVLSDDLFWLLLLLFLLLLLHLLFSFFDVVTAIVFFSSCF